MVDRKEQSKKMKRTTIGQCLHSRIRNRRGKSPGTNGQRRRGQRRLECVFLQRVYSLSIYPFIRRNNGIIILEEILVERGALRNCLLTAFPDRRKP